MMRKPDSQKFLVAMGSGIDSIVVAWLLKKQGHLVRGIYVDFAQDADRTEYIRSLEKKLGIPIQIIDGTSMVEAEVIQPWLRSRDLGHNISMRKLFQNRILFPKLEELRVQMGFDRIATGHYAVTQFDASQNAVRIYRALEEDKDEAEFLLGLKQEQIQRLELPLGTIPLSMCAKIAMELGISDFTPLRDHRVWNQLKEFAVKLATEGRPRPFDVFTINGERIGKIAGGMLFSIGDPWVPTDTAPKVQEESNDPYCVWSMDAKNDRLQIGKIKQKVVPGIQVKDVIWFSMPSLKIHGLKTHVLKLGMKKPVACTVIEYEGARARLILDESLKGESAMIFPGQTLLFLNGNEFLGGAQVFSTDENP